MIFDFLLQLEAHAISGSKVRISVRDRFVVFKLSRSDVDEINSEFELCYVQVFWSRKRCKLSKKAFFRVFPIYI